MPMNRGDAICEAGIGFRVRDWCHPEFIFPSAASTEGPSGSQHFVLVECLPVVWNFPSLGLDNQPCKTGLSLPNVNIWEEDLLCRERFMDLKLPSKENYDKIMRLVIENK